MTAVPRNDLIAFVAGSLYSEGPLSVEDAVAAALRLVDEFDDHGWSIRLGDPRIEHDLARNEMRVEFGGVDLTPAFLSVSGRVFDVVERGKVLHADPCPDGSEIAARAVAATLDYVSGWQADEGDRDDHRERAEQIRRYVEVGWRECACCPVCSEVVCDDDCPLFPIRDDAGCWVGSTGARSAEIRDEEISTTWTAPTDHWLGSDDVEEPEAHPLAVELADRFDERESDPGDAPISGPLAESLDRLAEQERSMGIDEVLTINDHMVSIQGTGETARFRWLGSNGVSRETALRHAAWIVAMGDPLDERFPKILDAVRST